MAYPSAARVRKASAAGCTRRGKLHVFKASQLQTRCTEFLRRLESCRGYDELPRWISVRFPARRPGGGFHLVCSEDATARIHMQILVCLLLTSPKMPRQPDSTVLTLF